MLKDYNPFLTLSRMKAESHALEGCPVQRAMWHIKQPPLGHHGVATPRIVDFDESCFYFDHANRSIAHARPGSTPIEHQWHTMDTKRTVVVGVDCIGTSWLRIQDDNLDEAGWLDFLQQDVLPTCGPNRVLMYDNLRAHVTVRATQLVIRAGHTPLARPVHSPWLAPIEFIFGLMEAHLRRISPMVTRENFRRCIISAFRHATTPANCSRVFAHCGL
jgi:transposase